MNLMSLSTEDEAAERKTYQSYAQRKEKAMTEISHKRNELLGLKEQAEAKKAVEPAAGLQQIAAYGEDVQKKSLEAANRILRSTKESIDTGNKIQVNYE